MSVVGEVVRFVDDSRPMVSSFRRLPLPTAGTQILRPKAIQRTTAAKQTEKAQLSSTQFQASGVTVPKAKYGTVLNITEQDLDWSTPDALQAMVEDMASSYTVDTEAATGTAVAAAITTNVVTSASFTDPSVLIPAIVGGITAVRGTCKRQPDALIVGGARLDNLTGLLDTTHRPVFPNVAEEGVLGLAVVYSNGVADDFMAVARGEYVETFEKDLGYLTIPVPSGLEVQVAYRGDFAVNVYAEALCAITS